MALGFDPLCQKLMDGAESYAERSCDLEIPKSRNRHDRDVDGGDGGDDDDEGGGNRDPS